MLVVVALSDQQTKFSLINTHLLVYRGYLHLMRYNYTIRLFFKWTLSEILAEKIDRLPVTRLLMQL